MSTDSTQGSSNAVAGRLDLVGRALAGTGREEPRVTWVDTIQTPTKRIVRTPNSPTHRVSSRPATLAANTAWNTTFQMMWTRVGGHTLPVVNRACPRT